jgi:hypothetical protein
LVGRFNILISQAGVIVKTILPDGVADKDGRLKPNDFILQVFKNY